MFIPVVFAPIFLGGAFNLFDVKPNQYRIFDKKAIEDHLQVVSEDVFQSGYIVPQTSSQIDEFLGVDPSLTLKSRLGDEDLFGFGHYLKSTINRERTVEILMRVYIEKETQTFPSNIKHGTGWEDRSQKDVGTHYIKGLKFGAQGQVSFQLKPTKPEYAEEIKSAVSKYIGESGNLDDGFFTNLEKVIEALQGKITLSTYVFGTSIGSVMSENSVAQVQKLFKQLPEKLKTVNGGKGNILKIELVDLSTIQPKYSPFIPNRALVPLIRGANDKLDDIRVAYTEFQEWQRNILLDEDKDKIANAFWKQLKRVRLSILSAFRNLDVTGSEHQLDEAFTEYNKGGDDVSYRYIKELMNLEKTLG